MITDVIISIIIAPVYGLFSLLSLPVVGTLEIPEDVFNGLFGFISNVAYIFPVQHLLTILIFSAVLDHFTTIWALILRIKSFIPTMGR